jgi:tripartite-type tricarboxylate transporter receptor subunit TctC
VPTVGEAGVPGYSSVPWYEVSAPKGVPKAVVDRLNGDIDAVLKMPDVVRRLAALGVQPLGGTPADAVARNQAETKKWSAVIEAAHLQAE